MNSASDIIFSSDTERANIFLSAFAVLNEMSQKDRDIFSSYLEGYTEREITKICNVPKSTVHDRIIRMKEELYKISGKGG